MIARADSQTVHNGRRFSDDPAAIEQREAARHFRLAVFKEVPVALYALGVGHPHRRWRTAVDELHRDRESEEREQKRAAQRALLCILTILSWEARGSPKWAPTLDDLEEAQLQMATLLRLRGAP